MVPAPPDVPCQRPQAFLGGADEAIQCARLADHRRHLAGCFDESANLALAEDPWILGLNHQHTLQYAAIDEGHTEKGVIDFLTRFLEILEAGMLADIVDGHRHHLFRHQPGEAFVERHAQCADATWVEPKGSRQHQVRSIRLKQIGRANIGFEPRGDQCHDIHQRVGGLATSLSEVLDFLGGQYMAGFSCIVGLGHPLPLVLRSISETENRLVG